MPKLQTDNLIQLISSLTKGEKRSFRLFVNRDNPAEEKLFMQLFDILDKQNEYDVDYILRKIPKLKKAQLSNVKANLYRQILLCLRNLNRNADIDISIRENLDYAKILYNKGLYKQSLELLGKARKTAIAKEQHALALTAIDFERHIESQHITGSMSDKAEEIKDLSEKILAKVSANSALANFSIMLYGFYLRYGYVKDEKDFNFVSDFFKTHHPQVDIALLGIYEKIQLYQCYVWFHNMTQDFPNYYRYAQRWIDVFEEEQEIKYSDTALYLKGYHNVLNALFMAKRYDKFLPAYEKFLLLGTDDKLISNQNLESLWTLFSYTHGINNVYMTADYEKGVEYVKDLESILEENKYNWDLNRIIVFYYKIACVYFGNDKWEETIIYLNKIVNNYYPDFRGDIQCFARILNLIAHFELGNDILVSYQVKSIYRFLLKMEDLGEVQKEIFKFVRKTTQIVEEELITEFINLKKILLVLQDDPYERRPFLYLDIISWLDTRIKGITMEQAIKENNRLT